MTPLLFAGLGALGLGAVFYGKTDNTIPPVDMGSGNEWDAPVNYSTDTTDAAPGETDSVDSSANVDAFLAALRQGESGGVGYGALYGGGTFADFSHHPADKSYPNAWLGVITKWGPTHAAGAYQFQPGTWKEAATACQLSDFSPDSQDIAARFLISRRGALDAVKAGDWKTAFLKLRTEWQSIPLRGSAWYLAQIDTAGGSVQA